MTATRLLDRLPWRGKPAVLSQATAWPRASVGVTTVPAGIEVAAILIAADLVQHPGGADGEPAATVREEEVGPKRVAYFHHSPDAVERTIGPALDALVRPYIAEWLALAPTSPYAVADAT